MPLLDFMHGRRSVVAGGRVFVVSRPTVETVFRLLDLFGSEIEACAAALPGSDIGVEVVLPFFTRDAERFGEVLETCVSGEGPPSSWPLDALARACLRDCDVKRIIGTFREARTESELVPLSVSRDNLEDVALCQIAKFYGVSPLELARWPFEAYISARAAADRIIKGDTAPKRWFMGTPTGDPGVSVM